MIFAIAECTLSNTNDLCLPWQCSFSGREKHYSQKTCNQSQGQFLPQLSYEISGLDKINTQVLALLLLSVLGLALVIKEKSYWQPLSIVFCKVDYRSWEYHVGPSFHLEGGKLLFCM